MSLNYYLQKNHLKYGKEFFAKTILKEKISEEDLLKHMAGKGTSLTITELEGVLNLLKRTIKELLLKGNPVGIENLVDIYPVVKGSFDTAAEGFNHNRNNISVRSRISRSLVKSIQSEAVVEQQNGANNGAKIISVISGKNNENVIRWPYSTTLKGSNLNQYNRDIAKIHISSIDNPGNLFIITADNLLIDNEGNKKLSFCIDTELEIPAWLTRALPVYLRIEYANGNENLNRFSTEVKTFWQSLPVESATQTLNNTEIEEELSA